MDNMILGRYIPGNSIVHRLDPRSKLVAMILLIMIFSLSLVEMSCSRWGLLKSRVMALSRRESFFAALC